MILHIAKRELYHNMNSLRFVLATLLIVALMIANAVRHFAEYRTHLSGYRKNVAESHERLRSHAGDLYDLIENGPGELYKRPSALSFCANGGEAFLPGHVSAKGGNYLIGWMQEGEHVWVNGIWRLNYPQSNPNLWNIRPDYTQIDWAFIVAVVLSFVAILFTFDAISGEREHGTLRLILSNSVSRDVVLFGKFIGALLSITIAFLIAVLVNLFLLSSSADIQFSASEWSRLGVIFLIALLYISIFIALGLLVSARVSYSSIGLMILLLIWAVFAVLLPNTLGAVASGLKPAETIGEFRGCSWESRSQLMDRYSETGGMAGNLPQRTKPPTQATTLWAKYITEEAELEERLNQEHLKAQINQIQLARSVTRLSPASIVQYTIESLAGTGFSRHLQFLDAVHLYARRYREFLIETDQADVDSLHLRFVREGMSEKPVRFESLPKFADRITFGGALDAAITNLLLLTLLLAVLSAGAFLAFLRVDV